MNEELCTCLCAFLTRACVQYKYYQSSMRELTTVITNTSEHLNLCTVMLVPTQTHSSQVGFVCDLDMIQGVTWSWERRISTLPPHSFNVSETTDFIWIQSNNVICLYKCVHDVLNLPLFYDFSDLVNFAAISSHITNQSNVLSKYFSAAERKTIAITLVPSKNHGAAAWMVAQSMHCCKKLDVNMLRLCCLQELKTTRANLAKNIKTGRNCSN